MSSGDLQAESARAVEMPYRPDFREFIRDLENLTPGQFILLVGLGAGILRGVPGFLLPGSIAKPAAAVAMAALSLLALSGAVLVWWIAVHRRRFSWWKTAWHLTLALALGDLLGFAMAFVDASMQSNGEFISSYFTAPLSTTMPGLLAPTLLRSPIRFLGSALLIALGRSLHEAPPPLPAQSSLSVDSQEAIPDPASRPSSS
jgi:hypothetical protein